MVVEAVSGRDLVVVELQYVPHHHRWCLNAAERCWLHNARFKIVVSS